MAGKFVRRFARRFVLVLAGLAVLTLAGPAAGIVLKKLTNYQEDNNKEFQ